MTTVTTDSVLQANQRSISGQKRECFISGTLAFLIFGFAAYCAPAPENRLQVALLVALGTLCVLHYIQSLVYRLKLEVDGTLYTLTKDIPRIR